MSSVTPPTAGSDALPTNRSGRTTALTTITALPRWPWSPLLRFVLWLKARQGPDRMLRRLSFIHVAYWVLIDRFPFEERRSRYSYLLFVSNFNGSWLDYIDTFSHAVATKMNVIWGTSFGFPGARPPRPFTDLVRANDRAVQHFFTAYPETTTEVASALRVSSLLPTLDPARPDAELVREFRRLLATVQRDL